MAAYLALEEPAFTHLVHRWEPKLFGFACRKLDCIELFVPDNRQGKAKIRSDADEVAERTLILTWKNIRLYVDTRKFSSWVYKICQNQCYSFIREESRRNKHLVPLPKDIDRMKYGRVRDCAEAKVSLDWILAVLNHRQHRLLTLVVEEGRNYDAVMQDEELFRANNEKELRDEFAVLMEIIWLRRDKEIAKPHKQGAEFEDISLRYRPIGARIKKDN